MILVTVGTTLPFDALIAAVDQFVKDGKITGRVVCQIGRGSYRPNHCEYFSFRPNLDALINEASCIIGHGGTGTVFSALDAGKPLVAVVNPNMADNHQAEFLSRLSAILTITWTRDLNEIPQLLKVCCSSNYRKVKGLRLVNELRAVLNIT